ncbi:hypothetical protein ACFSKW_45180 [Nonomuraea mangrovi]|uniref:Uncharacterized protein n=1 Tax=Nonomuraea mangrovi TaxID=2316207 RepID=A0ABW4TBA2_9ACTN
MHPPDAKARSISVQQGMGDGRLVSHPLKGQYMFIELARIP